MASVTYLMQLICIVLSSENIKFLYYLIYIIIVIILYEKKIIKI